MFSAIVLMCSITDPTMCYTAHDQTPHQTEEICRENVKSFLNDPLFIPTYLMFDENNQFQVVAARCLNWSETTANLDKSL